MEVVYLDDWLLLGENELECKNNVKITLELLQSLGFLIQEQKSTLTPAKSCKFLGFLLNSETLSLELTHEKRAQITSLISELKSISSCSIRKFAATLGVLSAACPAVEYGWAHTKALERVKFLALKKSRDNFDAKMQIPRSLHPDFDWWLSSINTTSNPIRQLTFTKTIYSDASKSGWGGFCEDRVVYDSWSHQERKQHINYLELLAAFNALKTYAEQLSNCEILLKIDNTTAISYINRMGGVKYEKLNSITADIWSWCEPRKLWLYATYIPSRENVEADQASRMENIDTEWQLADWAFTLIVSNLGTPDIDLFASRQNTKCLDYCSWHRDPRALCVDAFSMVWDSFFYAFPPFSLILKTLKKIRSDQACGIVVVPDWKAQPWYPLWLTMLVSPPLIFEPNSKLLLSNYRQQHPLSDKLCLMAGILSGTPTRTRTSKIHQ